MINLLLMFVMIAALGGMVFCGRHHRKDAKFQLLALTLLVIVIASGGLFMCSLSSMSLLGDNEYSKMQNARESKLQEAQGYVLANFIRNRFPQTREVLLIISDGATLSGSAMIDQLRNGNIGTLRMEMLHSRQLQNQSSGKLINPAMDRHAETQSIDAAIARHSDAEVVILYGVAPSGDSIRRLKVYQQPFSKRPKLIVCGLTNLNDWVSRQLRDGFFSALLVTDLTRVARHNEELPENLMEVFDSSYVLITPDNIKNFRRFFH